MKISREMTNKLLPLLSLLTVAHSHPQLDHHINNAIGERMNSRGGGLFHREEEWEYFDDDEAVDGVDEIDSEYLQDDESNYEYEEMYYDNEQISPFEDTNSDEQDNVVAGSDDQTTDDEFESDEYLLSTPIPVVDDKRAGHSWFRRIKPEDAHTGDAGERYLDETAEENRNEAPSRLSWRARWKNAAEPQSETLEMDAILPLPKPRSKSLMLQAKAKSKTARQPNQKSRISTNKSFSIPQSSSSKASFIYPISKLSSMVQTSSVRSKGRRGFSTCCTFVYETSIAIFQPVVLLISALFNRVMSFIAKWIGIILALLRQGVDALWYGPVDGVTTTGISRAGGLSGLLTSLPIAITASTCIVVGIALLLRREMIGNGATSQRENRFVALLRTLKRSNHAVQGNIDKDDEYYDSEFEEPSPEEDLQFLNSSFDAANPTSPERISKKIKKNGLSWPLFNTNQKPTPRQEKRQHQRSIKSIQKWWRQRPSSTVQIIEPSRAAQQPSSTQLIARLKNQLAQSEQERAVLQSDVARLQLKLQKAQHDAKGVMSKNQWLEKQQS